MTQPKLTSGHMSYAVANLVDWRKHVIVPNVSWGLFLNHECDLLMLDEKNRFSEIEIKISLQDLKADFKKKHNHNSKFITRLIYAVPVALRDAAFDLVPKHCGIITVSYCDGKYKAQWDRTAIHKTKFPYIKPDPKMIDRFLRLGCMRTWNLKREILYKQTPST